MIPIKFDGCNNELKKPNDMSDEQCMPLPTACGYTETGLPFFVSAWMPNKDDLDAINRGEPVYLQILSYTHPPVAVYTKDENGEINE